MDLRLVKLSEAEEKVKKRMDSFILCKDTNGEFINSVQYLSYHPAGRFTDDSVVVVDMGNQEIRGVFMAAQANDNARHIISHPGTTFSGVIMSEKTDIKSARTILDMILSYYEEKYDKIEIRLRPGIYDSQPLDWISYLMMRRNYSYQVMGLANAVNLTDMGIDSDIWDFFSSGRRNHLKKVLKDERYHIKENFVPSEEIWNNLNRNLREKFNSSSTHTYEEIVRLGQMFPGKIHAYWAEQTDGEYGAFALGYCFKKVFHTQYLDLNYAHSSEYPHLYLIYELMKIAKSDGYSYFSFGASTEKRGEVLNEGLYQYKNGYGGGAVLLPVMIWKRKN